MATVPALPGLYFQQAPARRAPSPLRSDVAGFAGRTKRGPADRAVRVEGLREYQQYFGGLSKVATLSYAIQGYFENGGQVAYVVRVLGPDEGPTLKTRWHVAAKDQAKASSFPYATDDKLPPADGTYEVIATSPGSWADGLTVEVAYASPSRTEPGILSFVVRADDEPTERFRVPLTNEQTEQDEKRAFEAAVSSVSRLIRIQVGKARSPQELLRQGPRRFAWDKVVIKAEKTLGDAPLPPIGLRCNQAVQSLCDQPEVAIMALPGLYEDLKGDEEPGDSPYVDLVAAAATKAAEAQDRVVVVDVPDAGADAARAIEFASKLRERIPSAIAQRAAALYHPGLRVDDPLGGIVSPFRTLPSSGHIAGVMSRVDREQGAHVTPANVPVHHAADVEALFDRADAELLSQANVNLVRCVAGRGLMVWGGRTLDFTRDGRFLGHRRFLHRLVRAIRRVAEPLVFDTNGTDLWLTLVRALSTVLLEAFRSGALKGQRPEEAFSVRCDQQTNALAEREQGRVLCEIGLALAAPMEFITLRVAVSQSGEVEVFDE